jgi:NADH dehydrogenase
MAATDCVTGAFGYSGSRIATLLLGAGRLVRTLTTRLPEGHALEGRVEVHPLAFEDAAGLRRALEGVDTLYNTYWVRFSKAGFSQADAVRNTEALFAAAREAGVRRVVHTSITNPSLDSPYEYFRGKARLEEALRGSGLSHAILRPAVLFGGGDILVNNICWMLRRFPVFGCFGDGRYRMRPIHVEDFARLAVEAGAESESRVMDAVGPETWPYRDLVRMLGEAIGKPRPIWRIPRWAGVAVAWCVGRVVGDVLLTRAEIDALMDDLLATEGPATGTTELSGWAKAHAETLGRQYGHELARRRRRVGKQTAS